MKLYDKSVEIVAIIIVLIIVISVSNSASRRATEKAEEKYEALEYEYYELEDKCRLLQEQIDEAKDFLEERDYENAWYALGGY